MRFKLRTLYIAMLNKLFFNKAILNKLSLWG